MGHRQTDIKSSIDLIIIVVITEIITVIVSHETMFGDCFDRDLNEAKNKKLFSHHFFFLPFHATDKRPQKKKLNKDKERKGAEEKPQSSSEPKLTDGNKETK